MEYTKTTDAKGRLTLGKEFANKTFIIKHQNDNEILFTLARVIPQREAWLYENPEAKNRVAAGLQQAQAGKFSDSPPDLDADEVLADELEPLVDELEE